MDASRLRARAFSFVAAVFSKTMACSQLRGTPAPLIYMSARRMGASGLPFAVAFHSQATSAAESLASLALAISSEPGMIFLVTTSWSSGFEDFDLAAGTEGGEVAFFAVLFGWVEEGVGLVEVSESDDEALSGELAAGGVAWEFDA